MDGRKQVLAIAIDPEAVKGGDVEMLQDLITAAINGAAQSRRSMKSAWAECWADCEELRSIG